MSSTVHRLEVHGTLLCRVMPETKQQQNCNHLRSAATLPLLLIVAAAAAPLVNRPMGHCVHKRPARNAVKQAPNQFNIAANRTSRYALVPNKLV